MTTADADLDALYARVRAAPDDDAPRLALADELTRMYSRRANRTLFLKGAPQLEFSTVAAAIDTAHQAQITQIALMPR